LALAAASAALGGAAGCRRRPEIVPYPGKPRGIVPGVATHYATAAQEGEHTYGLLVKTREGRPIHIEGSSEDPLHRGKTCHRILAGLLGLYDPDRLRGPSASGRPRTWDEVLAEIDQGLRAAEASAKGILLLMPAAVSPTRRSLVEKLTARIPRLLAVEYEPWSDTAERRAARAVSGASVVPWPHFDRARVIVSLGSDFLGTAGDATRAARAFARARGDVASMSRLYVLEGTLSLTGENADRRWAVRPSDLAPIAFALARALAARGRPLPAGVAVPQPVPAPLDAPSLAMLADDLHHAGDRALVVAGPEAPEPAHRATHLVNAMLGAVGTTTDFVPARELAGVTELATLVERMSQGAFGAALFWGVNPAYACSDHEAFARALRSVPLRVAIGQHRDETAELCTHVLAESHWLESWGDFDVTGHDSLLVAQPATAPLYDTLQGEDVLLRLLAARGERVPRAYNEYLRERWRREVVPADAPAGFERVWTVCLHDGVLRREEKPPPSGDMTFALAPASEPPPPIQLVLRADACVLDGRHANNGWLQELPDPVNKTCWGNPLSIAPADAARLGLSDGDVARVTAGAVHVEAPVVIEPAQAVGVLGLALGYGRRAGSIAAGVGTSAWPLLGPAGLVTTVDALVRTGRGEPLTRSQIAFDPAWRDIARVLTPDEAMEPHTAEPLASLYTDAVGEGPKWGMAIDLAKCTGCSACVIACQSENNVPVVGPEQVRRGRAMHWIRIDRYAHGSAASSRIVHEPMLCQHCGHAPCENVCPVQATNHSPDGLNQMVYNRCVGTRYCGNNCPYKVRRFNFLDFTGEAREPLQLANNPEVTVRPRGVMEKCTFCVQRIREAEQTAKSVGQPLRDGDIVPACAAACPTDAIVFGNARDPSSAVARTSRSARGYRILEELGVRPSVTYLAALRNPAKQGGGP
jgi:molybdopterin-containing oxidoreductase family iron-sulfur binding subunit